MFKTFVAQKLPFLQMPKKNTKTNKKDKTSPEDTRTPALETPSAPEEIPETTAPSAGPEALVSPAHTDAAHIEEAAEAVAEEGTAVLEAPPVPEPPVTTPETDFEAGMLACKAKNYTEALDALLRAAGAGHREAQFLCGQLYQRGLAADADSKLALMWYKRAAKQGFLHAQLACAAMYEEGNGTAVNIKRALYWYEQAAKQGSVEAQLKCGRMYYCGRAETRNPKKARTWLETAAEQGCEDAERLLSEYF